MSSQGKLTLVVNEQPKTLRELFDDADRLLKELREAINELEELVNGD